ncbi:TonB-dependent receptor [Pseudoalteromonas pernae]|uniref:TonB-dependent receptor n=1 Tax=Pseudoalteromonas pernae TaxID=3118054 RepID=UPI003242B8A1
MAKNKPKYLSLLISSILASSVSFIATAQQQEDKNANNAEEVEVIQVSGIRNSIKESNFRKQQATSVVDIVVADDIGKFPDENLADSLQRIPGITITRNNGEGQNILVRGLGGGYNITTLNGRKLASENAGRDFNFDTIASELVGALEVYKSPEARLIEGGIGAVVDVQTRKPFDLDGFTLNASMKGRYESRTEDVHPHASLIIGDTFNEWGYLFSSAYSKKTLRVDSYDATGFFDQETQTGNRVPVDINNDGVIDPSSEMFASKLPSYMKFDNAQDTRERLGATFAVQWQPTDNIDINLDTLYSRYETDGHKYRISFVNFDESWTPGTPSFVDPVFDESGRIVSMKHTDGAMVQLLNMSTPRKTDTWQTALNSKWYATEQFSFEFDYAHSEAREQNNGDNRFIVTRGFVDGISLDHNNNNKIADVILEPGLTADQSYGAHYSRNSGIEVENIVDDLKFSGQFTPDESIISKVNFGISYLKQSKEQWSYRSMNPSIFSNGGQYLESGGYDYDASTVMDTGDFSLFQIPSDVFVGANFDNYLDGEPSITPEPWPSFDYDRLVAFYNTISPEATADGILPKRDDAGSYKVSEQVTSAYVQLDIEDTLLGLPYFLNLGVRASKTQVNTTGNLYDLSQVTLDEFGMPLNDDWKVTSKQEYQGDYSHILPSANFKLSLQDNLIYRISAAKVMSRPELSYLRPWLSPNFEIQQDNLPTLSLGFPDLEPEEANQADMTLEWYFADSSSMSGGLFYKDIDSFIEYQNTPLTYEGVEYYASFPSRGEYGAKIKGVELAYQQSLEEWLPAPFDGLGFQFNYTYVESNYEDPELKAKNLPFRGMSKNSYNAVIYYENDKFEGRLAYNWRGKFLQDAGSTGGAYWIADYGQLDASINYNINDTVSVFAQANNLTNSRYWGYIKREDQVRYLERFGTQLSFGIRGSF